MVVCLTILSFIQYQNIVKSTKCIYNICKHPLLSFSPQIWDPNHGIQVSLRSSTKCIWAGQVPSPYLNYVPCNLKMNIYQIFLNICSIQILYIIVCLIRKYELSDVKYCNQPLIILLQSYFTLKVIQGGILIVW